MPHNKRSKKSEKSEKQGRSGRASYAIASIIRDIKSARLISILSSSFRSWYSQWPWILLSVVVDFLFLVSLGTVITLIQFTLFEHLEALMRMAGEASGGLIHAFNQSAEVASSMSGLVSTVDFQYHVNVIFKYLGILVLASFLLWVGFQGISWYIAYRMSTKVKRRRSFLVFWRDFALESLPFHLFTILLIFISVKMLFSIRMSITPLFGEDLLNFMFVLLVLVTWYFGSLCYTITSGSAFSNFKQSFRFGVRKFPKVILSFAAIAVIFIIIDLVLKISFIRQDPFVLMAAGTVLFMPAIVFARILLFRTRQAYWPVKK